MNAPGPSRRLGDAHLDLETRRRDQVDQRVQNKKVDLAAREVGNAGLGDAEPKRRLLLRPAARLTIVRRLARLHPVELIPGHALGRLLKARKSRRLAPRKRSGFGEFDTPGYKKVCIFRKKYGDTCFIFLCRGDKYIFGCAANRHSRACGHPMAAQQGERCSSAIPSFFDES